MGTPLGQLYPTRLEMLRMGLSLYYINEFKLSLWHYEATKFIFLDPKCLDSLIDR